MVASNGPRKVQARVPSSFRDPSGFCFFLEGVLYRQVNSAYRRHYDHLFRSGLYQALVAEGSLIPHEEVPQEADVPRAAYKVIRPQRLAFVSYPWEWCFSQWKDAAGLTLAIQRKALEFGMTLKDASAYNIQFHKGRPILIDTLSFEIRREGRPWPAYRQFCEHFLGPLALMSLGDIRLGRLFQVYADGIPLDLTAGLLPFRARLCLPLLAHLYLHAKAQRRFAGRPTPPAVGRVAKSGLLGLVDHLESAVRELRWKTAESPWSGYCIQERLGSEAFRHKVRIVSEFLGKVQPRPKSVWDLGANTGAFSRIASRQGIHTLAFDADPLCVEKDYLQCCEEGETCLLPLVMDLTNPSPGLGWECEERLSWLERGPADLVLALALVHHLAIPHNLPLAKIARFLSRVGVWLIVEFVPKEDAQVQRLLSTREDIFPDYTRQAFEKEFGGPFALRQSVKIQGTERVVYLMQRREVP
ncbi:MAG: SAM-dependent methyltransferase [Candidatus Omnitrophica bacterium]|nr:SAM-dependent methyltransferase [Candidatus Omnitrophota bacterium]